MSSCASAAVCVCVCVCLVVFVFMPGIGIFLLHLQFLFSLNFARLKARPICYASIACANCKSFQMKISIIMQRPREKFTTTINKNRSMLKMFTCILCRLAVLQKEIERCCDRDECAASRAYDANYAHITHTSRCHRQFPRAACVCAAQLRVIFAHGLWHVVLCSQQVLR